MVLNTPRMFCLGGAIPLHTRGVEWDLHWALLGPIGGRSTTANLRPERKASISGVSRDARSS